MREPTHFHSARAIRCANVKARLVVELRTEAGWLAGFVPRELGLLQSSQDNNLAGRVPETVQAGVQLGRDHLAA